MSLYNEVRPNTLAEVRGQEKIVSQIRVIIENGNVPNVSLFVGPRGTGKTTIARIFAKAINCANPSEDGPCNSCNSCRDISNDNSLDVVELDAASNNKVEDVHRVIESSRYNPIGKYKVYIIDEVHMLSTAAFNALLKLLEEPPAHCRFILCTTEEHKVPVTILSRCRKFYFERISTSIVAEKMKDICIDRNISFEEEALRLIAKKSEGCMRDAESLLEIFLDAGNVSMELVSDVLGTTNEEIIWNLLYAVSSGNVVDALSIFKEVKDKGKNLQVFLRSLIEGLTDLVYYHQANDLNLIDNTILYKERLTSVSKILGVERALEMASELSDIFVSVLKGGDISFLLETKLLTLINTQSLISDLQKRINCLENALFDGNLGITTSDIPSILLEKGESTVAESGNLSEQITSEELEESILSSFGNEEQEGSILPGDIFIPEGTEIKGTVSLFSEDTDTKEDIELPVKIDGFRQLSSEDLEDIPWKEKDSDKHEPIISEKEEMRTEVVAEKNSTISTFNPMDSLNALGLGIPTLNSFMNNF